MTKMSTQYKTTIEMDLVVQKPHVVCVPYPAQSHIKVMLKLAKLLCHRGFRITFVNTEFNHKRLLKSGGLDFLAGSSDFQFETIPDGIVESDSEVTQDFVALSLAMRDFMLSPFLELLERISVVTCIISDAFVSFPTYAGEKLGVPVILSWTIAACVAIEVCKMRETCRLSENDRSGVIVTDPDDTVVNYTIECAKNTTKSSANIIATFEELEIDTLNRISSMISDVYAIGPLEHLLAKLPKEEHLDSIGYSLLKEDPQCLKWLDSRKENSVLYVNMGSVSVMPTEKVMEFARGLVNSEKEFLWIIRSDMVVGEAEVLLSEILEGTKDRGFTASWCPQEDVLKHPSVFGFLTHCGWNSIIESLSSGVPMICLPIFGDQPRNSKYVCNELRVGVEMNEGLKSDDVERVVREFMEGDMGKKMKKKAIEWKEKADKTTSEGGSSFVNLDRLINKIIQF